MTADTGSTTDPSLDEATRTALKLWVVLARAHEAVAERARADIRSHGLQISEFAVLEALFHRGALTLGQVGEKVLLTSGSITYVVDKLERRGLLRRLTCPEDRRVCYAELTDAGRSFMRSVFPKHAEAVRRAVSGLSVAEQRRLTAMLKRMGHAAREEAS